MKKVLIFAVIATFFGCETISDQSYGGVFTGGSNTYKLQQGSDDYATMIKGVVLGYADGNFEEIIVNFSDSVTRREPGNVYKVAPSIERWEGFKENFDSINRNLTSVMAVKVNDDVSFVDALFSQGCLGRAGLRRRKAGGNGRLRRACQALGSAREEAEGRSQETQGLGSVAGLLAGRQQAGDSRRGWHVGAVEHGRR